MRASSRDSSQMNTCNMDASDLRVAKMNAGRTTLGSTESVNWDVGDPKASKMITCDRCVVNTEREDKNFEHCGKDCCRTLSPLSISCITISH